MEVADLHPGTLRGRSGGVHGASALRDAARRGRTAPANSWLPCDGSLRVPRTPGHPLYEFAFWARATALPLADCGNGVASKKSHRAWAACSAACLLEAGTG